jgi:flagellar hook-associated protein FlgK
MADILSISSSAVGVYQRVLGVTSNNIANVGNEGYVKQDASVSQTPPTFDGRNFLGTGAMFEGVQRQYNAFIENSLRNAKSSLNGQQALVQYANRVVDIMGSGEIGLSPALDRFFSAAHSLSADPASVVARATLLRESEGVAARFRDLANQLQQIEGETQNAIQSDLAEVNTLAAQLGKVNLELSRNRSLDRQPATLLDERDNLLRQLSERLDIAVTESANGEVTVSVGGAGSSGALVSGQVVKPLEATFDPQSPERLSLLLDPFGREPVSIAGVSGGAFGGLTGFRSMVLEPALSNLDLLAKTFMKEVNNIHTTGVDGYGESGRALFDIETTFTFDRVRDDGPLNIDAQVADLRAFDGKDIRLSFDAQAGQVYTAALLGPFKAGDRFEVSLNGLSKSFAIGSDTSLRGVADQLQQFIDGAFGVQLRTSVDPKGQVVINSSVMKSFSLDVKLSSDEARVQIGQSQGLWVAENRAGERITGSNALLVDGVAITIQGQAVDGEQLVVKASSRPAAGLRSLLTDPLRVAAASAFRVFRDNDNLSTVKATLEDRFNDPVGPMPAPVLGSTGGLTSNPVPSEAAEWVAQRVVPFATVAAGQRDVAIYLDPRSSQANLQVLTRDGRHLLGTAQADGASFVSNITSLPAPFNAGSTYSADYLNKDGSAAYRDLSLFYGARALPTSVQVMGTDHVPTSTELRPARLAAELAIPTGAFVLPANGVMLNGVALPTASATITGPQDMATLLNAAITSAYTSANTAGKQALEGITAQVRDGVLELTRPTDKGAAGQLGQISLGFGTAGSPALMAKMGFRSAAYLDGAMPEDLLVFTTGSGDVRIGASFAGTPFDPAQRRAELRKSTLEVEFTSASQYRITDVGTQTVLAERSYTPGSDIDYQGVRLSFTAEPRAGDVFRVDGNADGRGDNSNAVRLADLEKQASAGPGGAFTLGDAYLDVVNQIANVNQQSQVATRALEVVHQQAVEARESVSGVSLDEEAANLIRYQQAYQAAAKSMQVASQLFDTVLRI